MRMSLKVVFQCIATAILALAGSLTAFANQSVIVDCRQGGQPVVTSGLTSTTKVLQSYPSCTITVSVHGGGIATIFSDNSGTPLANPFTAQNNPYPGAGFFYAANGRYDITISGGGITSPLTFSDILLNDPATLTGCSQLPALTGDVTSAGGTCATVLPNIASAGTGLKTTVNAKGQVTAVATAASTDLSDTALVARLNAAANFGINPISAGPITGTSASFSSVSDNGETVAGEIAPDVTGRQLGDVAHRWDGFIRNLDVAGTITGAVTGTGTTGNIPKFTGVAVIGNSGLSDNGTTVTNSENESITGTLAVTGASTFGSGTFSGIVTAPNLSRYSRDCRADGNLDVTGATDASAIINNCIANAKANAQSKIIIPCGNFLINTTLNATNFPGLRITGCGQQPNITAGPVAGTKDTNLLCNTGNTTWCIETVGSPGLELDHFVMSLCCAASYPTLTNTSRGGILQGRDNAAGGGAGAFCFSEQMNFHNLYITDNGGAVTTINGGRGQVGIYNVGAEDGIYTNVQILTGAPMVFSQTDLIGSGSTYQTLQAGCPASMVDAVLVKVTLVGSITANPLLEANITNQFTITGLLGNGGSGLFKFENTGGAAITADWNVQGAYENATADVISTSVGLDNMHFSIEISNPAPGVDIKMLANNLTLSNSQFLFGHLATLSPDTFINNTATGTTISGSILMVGGTTSASNTTVNSSVVYAPFITDANITFAAASNYEYSGSSGLITHGVRRFGIGTVTNPGICFQTASFPCTTGFYISAINGLLQYSLGSTAGAAFGTVSISRPVALVDCWTSTADPNNSVCDTGISRGAAKITYVGNGTAGDKSGFIQSGNTVRVASDFTTANNTSLQTITGLSWTFPAVAANYSFHCSILYSQATAAVSNQFGIQAATNSPTNIQASGIVYTSASVSTAGNIATLATTTATPFVTFTPSATATNFVALFEGTLELPASANTINIMVSTSAGADAITIRRGSYCQLF